MIKGESMKEKIKRLIIWGTILAGLFLIVSVGSIAYESINRMYFDTGTATLQYQKMGIFKDTFSVTFDTPMPNTEYTITYGDTSAFVNETWVIGQNANLGYSELTKICHTDSKSREGFTGHCNWRLHMISMAYGDKGEYANYWSLNTKYDLRGKGDTWDKVEWQLMGKADETKGIFSISRR
jgi:hypothetical protein